MLGQDSEGQVSWSLGIGELHVSGHFIQLPIEDPKPQPDDGVTVASGEGLGWTQGFMDLTLCSGFISVVVANILTKSSQDGRGWFGPRFQVTAHHFKANTQATFMSQAQWKAKKRIKVSLLLCYLRPASFLHSWAELLKWCHPNFSESIYLNLQVRHLVQTYP